MYRVICPVCKTGFEAKFSRENCAINCVSCRVAFNALHYLPKSETARKTPPARPPANEMPQRYLGPVLLDPPSVQAHRDTDTQTCALPFNDSRLTSESGSVATLEMPAPRKASPELTPLPQLAKTQHNPPAANPAPAAESGEFHGAVLVEPRAPKPGPLFKQGPVLTQPPVLKAGPVLNNVEEIFAAAKAALPPVPLPRASDSSRNGSNKKGRRPLLEGSFGCYDIEGEIARGGVGAVFRARERETGKPFALKVLIEGEEAGETERDRFRHECETAKALSLPGMVQIHEVGEIDGRPFMAMELVEGKSLDRVIAEKTLGVDDCLVLMKSVAETVGALHEAGYVHRDLKPGNILLDSFGSPKVADFGLVKSLDEVTRMTASGLVCGTPAYMSPEQARGEGRNVDPRSDVWALGGVLYEMLAGEPPFKADNALKLMLRITKEQPRKLSTVNRKVPSGVESIVMKCLEKKPALRYANGRELAADIANFREGKKLRVETHTRMGRFFDGALENRARLVPAVAAVAALLLIALVAKLMLKDKDAGPLVERGNLALSDTTLAPADKLNLAERNFREALTLDPKNARAYMGLGLCLARRGIDPQKHAAVNPALIREAFKMNDFAAQLDPRLQTETLANAARYNMWLNDHVSEAAQLERAVRAAPANLKIRESLGLAYWNAGAQTHSTKYYQSAVKTFEGILAAQPDYPKVQEYIHQIYDKFLAQGRASAMTP